MSKPKNEQLILWFDEISKEDIALVGGKNANLGELYQKLAFADNKLFPRERIQVPYGFAITAYAYRYFMEVNDLAKPIQNILKGLSTKNIAQLEEKGQQVRQLILSAQLPGDLELAIKEAYAKLGEALNLRPHMLDVAVRSSATTEDLVNASFAGQQESYLNIRGEYQLLESVKKAFASLYTNRAISYRVDQKYSHTTMELSVAVQKMVRADMGASGVMFTLDTDTGFEQAVLINASLGLGELIVKGNITPDEYTVFKPTLKQGYRSIIGKKLGSKEQKLVYSTEGVGSTKVVPVSDAERHQFALSEELIIKLSQWGLIIEDHYGRPMDIEWAYDGVHHELYIVQARPETVQARRDTAVLEEYVLEESGKLLVQGAAVGNRIGQGKAHFIQDIAAMSQFKPGEVLVTEMTDPDWEPVMKIASAIVTNAGGRTSHAAIVSRELGIPAVVGTGNATAMIRNGSSVTVCCNEGEHGVVYEGLLKFHVTKHNVKELTMPKTEVKMVISDPELAFNYSFIPNKGIGLAREEFIVSNFIRVHPNALLNYKIITDPYIKAQIDEMTVGYDSKVDYFIKKLSYGIGMIAASVYPNPVHFRFSDFKTNEYRRLIGGMDYEPQEENPMIGWRGASRYYDPRFRDAFALECAAFKRVREEMGLANIHALIPFCRTPEEAAKVLAEMAKNGLVRGKGKGERGKGSNLKSKILNPQISLEVWCTAELPSNFLEVEDFANYFDGFSIGTNDLTQLVLGIDRGSKLVSQLGNEKNKSVLRLIHHLISRCHALGLKVDICGQAPSDFPEFAEFLVKEGIDSISLNPDSMLKSIVKIKRVEDGM